MRYVLLLLFAIVLLNSPLSPVEGRGQAAVLDQVTDACCSPATAPDELGALVTIASLAVADLSYVQALVLSAVNQQEGLLRAWWGSSTRPFTINNLNPRPSLLEDLPITLHEAPEIGPRMLC
jgi:hypothetical protein